MGTKICLWCSKIDGIATFLKKAHTIPKSLGGQHFNKNVCDECNCFFGDRKSNNGKYSIEVALKEAFAISRYRFLSAKPSKKQVGKYKSQFFDITIVNGKYGIEIKESFKKDNHFQFELARSFKRGLLKMYFEELNRQTGAGFETEYNWIRDFARFDKNDFPVIYFRRKYGLFVSIGNENETPKLLFNRMNYLYKNESFVELEFLGHVFGFPVRYYSKEEWNFYLTETMKIKKVFFNEAHFIEEFTDIDLALSILDKKM